jgi:hypothetical protein
VVDIMIGVNQKGTEFLSLTASISKEKLKNEGKTGFKVK